MQSKENVIELRGPEKEVFGNFLTPEARAADILYGVKNGDGRRDWYTVNPNAANS